jgi:HSP20 family molecular chaperone IbpA
MDMTTLARRERPVFGELLDWLDTELRTLPAATTAAFGRGFRIEDFVEDDHYVLRAELPGMDPDKDLEVLVRDGVLTVNAQRREETREGRRSEFHYGSYTRSVALPANADEDDVAATYTGGILLVRVGLTGVEPKPRRIPIATPGATGEAPAVDEGAGI